MLELIKWDDTIKYNYLSWTSETPTITSTWTIWNVIDENFLEHVQVL